MINMQFKEIVSSNNVVFSLGDLIRWGEETAILLRVNCSQPNACWPTSVDILSKQGILTFDASIIEMFEHA